MLQQRNRSAVREREKEVSNTLTHRLLKRLGRKGEKEAELERKEKGFSLYLNGANTAPPPPARRLRPPQSSVTTSAQQEPNRPSRTAGTYIPT